MTQKTKKNSAAKKLVPAAGMLAVSAMMLATSTYAWFTMAREVEVNNIQMTATVPEDIQISLGHLTDFAGSGQGDANQTNAPTFTGLAGNQGKLAGSADDGNATAPYTGSDAVSALDWSSSADISEYYRLGKIIPASSTTGANIYFTPDAAGVGKTLKAGAKYYQAADISGAKMEVAATGRTADANNPDGSLKTKLHAITDVTEANDKWNTGEIGDSYQTATEWNITNDDGYYVDIPIWFRSSAQSELSLSVDAYVTTKQAKDDDDLYLAARAVILYNDTEGNYAAAPTKTTNPLRIRKDNYQGNSIVDYMYTTNSTGDAVERVASNIATYGDVLGHEYTGVQFLKVSAGANNTYGTPTKAIIRVWLEGEDPNCWNSNAGQDFAISLKFSKYALSESADPATYPITAISHTTGYGDKDSTNSLKAGARVWVKSTTTPIGSNEAKTDELQFEYNGEKWSLVTDGSFHKYEGFTYTLGDATFETSDDIADYLATAVKTLADVEAHDTLGDAFVINVAASGSTPSYAPASGDTFTFNITKHDEAEATSYEYSYNGTAWTIVTAPSNTSGYHWVINGNTVSDLAAYISTNATASGQSVSVTEEADTP